MTGVGQAVHLRAKVSGNHDKSGILGQDCVAHHLILARSLCLRVHDHRQALELVVQLGPVRLEASQQLVSEGHKHMLLPNAKKTKKRQTIQKYA